MGMTCGATANVDVAIIGAGASGVGAARHLATAYPDLKIQVLEAGSQMGGRARTVLAGAGSLPLDLGCGWLHGARDNAWTAIAQRLGFTIDDARAPWDGSGREMGLNDPEEADALAAMQRFFQRAHEYGPDRPDIPLSALLEPGGRWNGLIDAVGTYINGVELDRASLRDYQRYDPGCGPDRRVRDGYGRVVERYAAGLPVSCGTVVRSVDHSGLSVRLETNLGSLSTRAVIVTVSTTVLASEAIRFWPGLPEKTEAASALPLGVANKMFLSIPAGVPYAIETHLLGSPTETRTGTYHMGPFGRPVIECYFGGELARDVERDREAGWALIRDELAGPLGRAFVQKLEPLAASAWAGEPHIGGSYSYAEPGAADLRAVLAAPIDDRLFFAGEACSRNRYSTAHGAFEVGVIAADAAAKALCCTARVASPASVP